MKRPIEIKNFKDGETRIRIKFAWLPKKVVGFIIWLHYYESLEVFRADVIQAEMNGQQVTIIKKYWDVIETRIKQ